MINISIDNISREKLFLLITIIVIVLVSLIHRVRENNLLRGFEQSKGVVVKVLQSKNGGGIQFTYGGPKSRKKTSTSNGLSCKLKVKKMIKKVQKHKFPVVFLPSDPTNAEILLFESQYRKYDVKIPEDLEEIVKELSECEK